tara:strand:- start:3803 stop:4447 length:645 start_codon:yes stop_codon:yes gene_type:complete
MDLKRIGISSRIMNIEKFDEKRDAISHDWIDFLQKLEILPIIIPNKLKDVDEYISTLNLNGIILSGGDNIGEFPERDKTEIRIIDYSTKNNIPILGVCRGMQLINEFFSGKNIKSNNLNHVGKYHNVKVKNSNFKDILGEELEVNSFHNNLIKKEDVGQELEIFAESEEDSTIEGYFHKRYPIIGIMWHPERDQEQEYQSKIINILYNQLIWKS